MTFTGYFIAILMCSILTSTLALFRIPSISRSVQHSVSFSKISRTTCYSRRQFSLLNGPKGDSDLGVSTATSIIKNNGASFVNNLLKMLAIVPVVVATAANADEATDATSFTNLDSGLKYRDLKVGEGAVPVPGDTVRVHYTGWLDGFDSSKKFDSSYDRRSPLVFKVGVRQVIAGWDEGILTNLHVGGKRELIIPAELGYGSRGAGGVIPPGATLYFRIELVGIGAR